ncbi:MAG: T9SS type A sorting domain-containing protein [Fibrobacteres bacterium]|nr:T9SS type A sorting domain-containing protein [Fibrobacterota bacterium]
MVYICVKKKIPISYKSHPITLSCLPNPFNPSCRIHFTLAEQSHIRVAVYDAKGRMVRKLKNGIQNAGTHVLTWNGNSSEGTACASGLYFFHLTVGNHVLFEKGLLSR